MPGRIVETTGARMFGLDDAEVTGRRRYVGRVRREIQVRLYPPDIICHIHYCDEN